MVNKAEAPDVNKWGDLSDPAYKGKADDAAYNWINFVLQPEIVKLMSASTGAIASINGAADLLPEDMEGKALEKIKAATGV